jgi:hypothetical protein
LDGVWGQHLVDVGHALADTASEYGVHLQVHQQGLLGAVLLLLLLPAASKLQLHAPSSAIRYFACCFPILVTGCSAHLSLHATAARWKLLLCLGTMRADPAVGIPGSF